EDMPFEESAILADAVSTPYHALRFVGGLEQNQNVAVIGCGGLGIHAIKLARALKAKEIYAFDIDPQALKNAKNTGATEIFLLNNFYFNLNILSTYNLDGNYIQLQSTGRNKSFSGRSCNSQA
ncbi:MAG: 50S ribosomal protein L11 methyltransferase, partial [Ignavibacterium sp.]